MSVVEISIPKSQQRKGITTYLVELMEEEVRRKGMYSVEISQATTPEMKAFCKARGFERVDESIPEETTQYWHKIVK